MRSLLLSLLCVLSVGTGTRGDVPGSPTRDLLPREERADRMKRRNLPPPAELLELDLLRRIREQERFLERLRDQLDDMKQKIQNPLQID